MTRQRRADRWHELVELALRERELLETGLWDDLLALQRERAELAEALPSPAPPEARRALEQAHAIVSTTITTLRHRCHEVAGELGRLGQGRQALSSYSTSDASELDLRG